MGGGMPFAFAADVMGVVWHATMLFSQDVVVQTDNGRACHV